MRIAVDLLLLVLIVSGVVVGMATLYGLRAWWTGLARILVLLCCAIFGIGGIGMAIYVLVQMLQTHAAGLMSLMLIYLICGVAGLLAMSVFARMSKKH
ncbi:hypothetical protein [Lacticaseibacillus hulanensis]|uniref:hypothetical protein n=1 Tax=Lacticaseibacillus hulanensis TaxID=2493111 RepID=UPI000FD8A790|nr:hypothetical protein [Lacticaseibacillus hulanensis]